MNSIKMVLNIMDTNLMEWDMDKEYFITKMVGIMTEIGNSIICMVMVFNLFKLKERSIIQMVIQLIKDHGIKINFKATEYYIMKWHPS